MIRVGKYSPGPAWLAVQRSREQATVERRCEREVGTPLYDEKATAAMGPSSNQPSKPYFDPSVQRAYLGADCLVVVVLAALSMYGFVRRGATAFEWPAVDMACYFQRQEDPAFLADDYFTNSISKSNPRHVFGQLVLGLAWLTGDNWYGAYFTLRVLLTALTPPLWYLALLGLAQPRFTEDRHGLIARALLCTAILLVMGQNVSAACSIAWWQPLLVYAGPQPLGVVLTLGAIALRTLARPPTRHLSLPLWFAATLIHPAIGLWMAIFYWLARLEFNTRREFAAELLVGVVLPYAAIYAMFRVEAPLTATEFVDYYAIEGHPFHYQIKQFASMTRRPWWITFLAMSGVMAAVGAAAAARRHHRLATLSAAFVLAYFGSIVVQYIAVDLWPNKFLAIVGPSRFTFLGYYMASMLVALAVCEIWPRRFLRNLRSWPSTAPLICIKRSHAVTAMVGLCLAGTILLGDKLEDNRRHFAELYDWIDEHSDPDDVFLTPFRVQLNRELPVFARRAVFASQCFPFREDAIREHMQRVALAYGSAKPTAEGVDQIEQQIAHYRALGPAEFLGIADRARLDYVVVERDHAQHIDWCEPRYRDRQFAVYDVRDLRRIADARRETPRTARMPGE